MDVYGLCLGGNVFGWTADRDASFAVLDAYVEAGGNFIDTADTYMRPNMGISETIIGEWMAARGNRDELVIATKVGSDGGLSAANIAAHVDGVAGAAADRPHRPLLRAQGRRVGAGRGDRARVRRDSCATARCCTSRRPTCRRERLVESLELAEREGLAPYEWLQPHYNLVEREGYERDYAPIVERFGLAVAPYYALASGFLTGKYRSGDANGDSPRAETARRATSTSAARRVLAALDEVAAAHGVARRRGRDRVAAGEAGHRGADRQRADGRAARRHPARRRRCSADDVVARSTRRRRNGRDPPDLPRRALRARPRARRALDDRLERFRNVEPETAELLGVLVRALGAKRVLEIGTSNGYSTIWLGDAAEAVGGTVLSLEIEAEPHRPGARQPRARPASTTFVELRTQDAAEALARVRRRRLRPDLPRRRARASTRATGPTCARAAHRGLLVVDNTLSHAKDLVEFSELVYSADGVTSTLVTVGAGVLLIVKSPVSAPSSTLA